MPKKPMPKKPAKPKCKKMRDGQCQAEMEVARMQATISAGTAAP